MKLYEIKFIRHYEGDDFEHFSEKEKTWQIPADGQWNACAALGLSHTDEDFRIDVQSVIEVK